MSRATRTVSGKSHWTDPAYKFLPQIIEQPPGKVYQHGVRKLKEACDPSHTPHQILLPSNLVQEEIASFRVMQVLCNPCRMGRSGSRPATAVWFLSPLSQALKTGVYLARYRMKQSGVIKWQQIKNTPLHTFSYTMDTSVRTVPRHTYGWKAYENVLFN